LPPALTWIEADRKELLDAKADVLADTRPRCIVSRLALDLADARARRDALAHVAGSHERVVVVTEGVLVYLDEALVSAIANELRALPAMRRWILETAAPAIVERTMRAWGEVLAAGKARWRFAPPSGLDFFRARGWAPAIHRPFFLEARRLGRDREVRHAWLVRALSSLSRRFRDRLAESVVYAVMEPAG
ncbi:MAG: class I SAM-dependent methyltransferase, partial [Myxococcales bacterium]|nr:class I SAM-dependent methyltransferase [Myxococcales bacterium]